MPSDDSQLARDLQVLDLIEDAELGPLNWGLVDGGFSSDEIDDLIETAADSLGDPRSASEIRRSLVAHGLIVPIRNGDRELWRTRMSEGVRLLARMRQLFPHHVGTRAISAAPRLVSDYRFLARRRRFPRRDLTSAEFLDHATSRCADAEGLRGPLAALADSTLRYSGFQARAAAAILERSGESVSSATLVSAGTGAGKTKAFYLPALARVASLADGASWTKLLAIYPRKELLKDQLLKALRELRALRAATGIQLTIGALYGDVPFNEDSVQRDWPARGPERVCPYLACPSCESEMFWKEGSRGEHLLRCSRSRCSDSVGPSELVLTRLGMQAAPPDVLLATGEMLNRNLADDYSRKLFGLGVEHGRRPRFLLLDEVHTLTGSLGAQTALLIRRWRHSLGAPVHTVALSATLEDGARFLAQLLGLPVDRVGVVEPDDSELVDGGNEYLIALRSDPASKAAVLSTTIQASMLMRRLLDLPAHPKSKGAFGTKAFVFTDDLDVTNRLLHFLRNAEGQTDDGRPDRHRAPKGSLANLRHPSLHVAVRAARDDGQVWELPLAIGHLLDPAQTIRIERTSSQDPGLEKSSDIVVATASLEVGLDDDSVGAVLQHKAPRDSAAFVQRRGRAGRQQKMRPWTAVVLSDYGRDRQVFQAWDELFAPVLRPSKLPVGNRHILRMQATYCLIDWLAERLRDQHAPTANTWAQVAKQSGGGPDRRDRIAAELESLLDDERLQSDFAEFVGAALGCEADEVDRLLWGAPRGVLAAAAPTLLRRLRSRWASAVNPAAGDLIASTPLPDFVPSALFNDLLLPEVEVELPESVRLYRDKETPPFMGVAQALREFAPGKVTHRFAIRKAPERTWIDPQQVQVDVGSFCSVEPLTVLSDDSGNPVEVFRPTRITPEMPAKEVASTSNARPRWISHFEPRGDSVELQLPDAAEGNRLIVGFSAHLHESGGYCVVHRASLGSNASIQIGREKKSIVTEYRYRGEPVALGFRVDCDALKLTVADPGEWHSVFRADPGRARSLRAEWFRHIVEQDSDLLAIGSIFLSRWLAEVSLALIIEQSSETGELQAGVDQLLGPEARTHLDRILTVVFQSFEVDQETDVDDEELRISTLHDELLDLAATAEGRRALSVAAAQFLEPDGEDFWTWLRQRYITTIAGAFVAMATELDTEIRPENLLVDVLPWVDGNATVIISEPQPGGMGLIARVVDALQEDPRRAWRLFELALRESDDESVGRALAAVVSVAAGDPELSEAFTAVRTAERQSERSDAWAMAIARLGTLGHRLTQSAKVAVSLRMLRAGTTSSTDSVLKALLATWDEIEARLGVEVEVRTFAYLMSSQASFDAALSVRADEGDGIRSWRFSALLSLLWARDRALASNHLSLWSPYNDLVAPERTLVADRLPASEAVSRLRVQDAASAPMALAAVGEVDVECEDLNLDVKGELLKRLIEPLDIGVLELFPRLVGVRREGDGAVVRFEIPEVVS